MVEFQRKDFYSYEDFLEIMRLLRAPGGCPWDREQTHSSIRRNFLEETYEVLDAIDHDDASGMCEELGDVLMQVAFHAQIEAERGRFTMANVVDGLTRAGAERRGLTVRETSLTEDYRPDFMLTTTPVTSILTWDPETRKVKGGQFCSKADISGAANVISMAIQAGFTIDQLANVDFLFQPNFDKPVYYVGAVAMKAAAE